MVTAHKRDLAQRSGMEEEGRMAGPGASGQLPSSLTSVAQSRP